MKRIRQYLARISKTAPPPAEGQEHQHHLQVAKSTTTLSTTHSDNRPSFDENGVGAVVVCEGLPDGKEDEAIDIIFVHHAGGSRVKSWTKNDCFWPRDLLAQDFPHARIITVSTPSRRPPPQPPPAHRRAPLPISILPPANRPPCSGDTTCRPSAKQKFSMRSSPTRSVIRWWPT